MFELCGLGRIKGCSAPGLLFPLFSIRTSNYTFVHELNRSYVIQCFRRCDAGYFDVIPHLHDGKFVEGGAGLIGFENPPVGIFLGTHSELMRWWPINSNAVPENGLLRAILTEIVSDDSMNKYQVWREYINEHFSGIKSTSETTEVKLAQIQNWNKLWADLEDDRQSAEQQDQEFIKHLFEQPKREIIEWLEWNCSSHLWRRVWERADRYILQTTESRELIYAYIEYCLLEIPSELHGNMSYLLRRAISDEMLRAVGDDRIEILREFFELGVVLLKRAGVLPSEFRDYCIRLYCHYPGSRHSALVLMLKSVTLLYAAEESVGAIINFLNLEIALRLLSEDEEQFTMEELRAIVDFGFNVVTFTKRAEGLQSCMRSFDRLMRPYGMNSVLVRDCVSTSRPRGYLYEMITATRMHSPTEL